ncbi:MAG: imidazole glycerol phosphate synthase subunit HisH [Bacteroidaceae bacterium]|nr:imidazole glycerol phosphate synthase subunit HisH [Bacteroidaceae bacterium]
MEVAIIKYNAGNIYSVVHALKRLGTDPIVTDDAETIKGADCVLFPGQGEAAKTMEYLRERHLDSLIKELAQPVLGICIGMQLMCSCSEENDATCLGIFDVPVKKFVSPARELKIPHMGWDSLSDMQTPLFKGLNTGDYVYFIHSYYVPLNEHTIAQNNYILPFSAAIHKGNFYATQFHPEKSGTIGNTILQNFLDIASQS